MNGFKTYTGEIFYLVNEEKVKTGASKVKCNRTYSRKNKNDNIVIEKGKEDAYLRSLFRPKIF